MWIHIYIYISACALSPYRTSVSTSSDLAHRPLTSTDQRTDSLGNMKLKKHLTVLEGILFMFILLSTTLPVITCCMVKSDESGQHLVFSCQLATHQGRRKYQEDRMLCAHEMYALGTGFQNTSVHIAAIFDGHNGAEASEMASKLLLKHFFQHVRSLHTDVYSISPNKSHVEGFIYEKMEMALQLPYLNDEQCLYGANLERGVSPFLSRSVGMEILKESIMRTIYSIDLAFSKDALQKNLKSGSTAVIVLMIDDEFLVVNVGDSKAILCSKSTYLPKEVKGNLAYLNRGRRHKPRTSTKSDANLKTSTDSKCFLVNELTEDHHPDVDVERNRVEATGGYVEHWAGVSRVNGQLAVSRSIGDVHFKRYGVISTPNVMDWRRITSNDTYLVLGSDGIFEKITTQEVCNLLWDATLPADVMTGAGSSTKNSLADYVVNVALERGTTDNMSVIIIPLESSVQ